MASKKRKIDGKVLLLTGMVLLLVLVVVWLVLFGSPLSADDQGNIIVQLG